MIRRLQQLCFGQKNRGATTQPHPFSSRRVSFSSPLSRETGGGSERERSDFCDMEVRRREASHGGLGVKKAEPLLQNRQSRKKKMIGVGHSPHSPEPNAGAMYGYICHEFFRNHFKLLQEIILLVVEEVIVDMNMIIAWLVSGVNDLL